MDEKNNVQRANYIPKIILPSMIIFGLQIFISAAGGFFAFCLQAHNYTTGGYKEFMAEYLDTVSSANFNVYVSLIYALVAGIMFAIMYYMENGKIEKSKKGIFAVTTKPTYLIAGILLFSLGMQYVCTYMMNALAVVFPEWLVQYESLMEGMGLDDVATVPLALYSVLLGPICEELAFRGLTFTYARKVMPFWTANIVQALLFAGMHMNPLQASYTFVLGLFLGYFMEKTQKLALPIAVHIVFNGIAVLANALIVAGDSPVAVFTIIFGSLVATYGGYLLITRYMPTSTTEME